MFSNVVNNTQATYLVRERCVCGGMKMCRTNNVPKKKVRRTGRKTDGNTEINIYS